MRVAARRRRPQQWPLKAGRGGKHVAPPSRRRFRQCYGEAPLEYLTRCGGFAPACCGGARSARWPRSPVKSDTINDAALSKSFHPIVGWRRRNFANSQRGISDLRGGLRLRIGRCERQSRRSTIMNLISAMLRGIEVFRSAFAQFMMVWRAHKPERIFRLSSARGCFIAAVLTQRVLPASAGR